MSASDENIIGGRQLAEFLATLPAKIEANIMRSALGAGAREMAKEIRERAPVGPPSDEGARLYGGYEGALRDSVRVYTKIFRGKVVAGIRVGGKTKKGASVFYAHIIEYGSRPHLIKAKPGGAIFVGGSPLTQVMHPGTRPNPFVRPAFDMKAQDAIAAVSAQIGKRLTKAGINVPAPEEE